MDEDRRSMPEAEEGRRPSPKKPAKRPAPRKEAARPEAPASSPAPAEAKAAEAVPPGEVFVAILEPINEALTGKPYTAKQRAAIVAATNGMAEKYGAEPPVEVLFIVAIGSPIVEARHEDIAEWLGKTWRKWRGLEEQEAPVKLRPVQ